MAQPNNSYAREARRNLQDGPAAQRAEREREQRLNADPERAQAVRQVIESLGDKFDALQVGDRLDDFGLAAGTTVAKKNRKSVVTTMGSKFTKRELTGKD